jgi:hypothetical protein
MPKLVAGRHAYDVQALEGWVNRRRDAIQLPDSSAQLLRLFKRKRGNRSNRTRRFFGEIFVLSTTPHREAHYSSVKWLTNPRFGRTRSLVNPDHERLRLALHQHFGRARIVKLQQVAGELADRFRKELRNKPPTAPDLWLICSAGRHRFIEVKLPGDFVAPHQLAGMAAIASVLGSRSKVSVEVMELHDEERMFRAFCRAAASLTR